MRLPSDASLSLLAHSASVKQLTAEFGNISAAVRAAEARLRPSRAALADLVVRLQGHEKDKLMLTAKLHVQRRKIRELEAAEEFVEPELTYELRGFNLELQECVKEINEIIDEFQAELQEEVGELPDGDEGDASTAAAAAPSAKP